MLTCDHARTFLQDRLDGALLPLDLAAVETHLSSCPDCRAEATALAALADALHHLPEPELAASLAPSVMARLPEMLPARAGPGHLVRWGVLAAAAVVLFALGLALLPRVGGPAVARETATTLLASAELSIVLLGHAARLLAVGLDAAASGLLGSGTGFKVCFAVLFVLTNLALLLAMRSSAMTPANLRASPRDRGTD